MFSYLVAKGLAYIVVVPFILLLWISTFLICFLLYKFFRGEI